MNFLVYSKQYDKENGRQKNDLNEGRDWWVTLEKNQPSIHERFENK